MNTFADAVRATAQHATDRRVVLGENGTPAYVSTLNANVDLFGQVGGMRGKDIIPLFSKAYAEDSIMALHVIQYARDIRGGMGEREAFRQAVRWVEANDPQALVDTKILENLVEIGRFDDLLIFETPLVRERAFELYRQALLARNGLAAKWAPRKGPVAAALRAHLRLTPKQYRKLLVGLSNTVETKMCAKEWEAINFSHVPSVASLRYRKAFKRNAPEHYQAFLNSLQRGEAKVNAAAVFPHDVIRPLVPSAYSFDSATPADIVLAENMWKALPDYIDGSARTLVMADVSGSMSGTPMEVSIALALYISERQKSEAFKDLFLTFAGNPTFHSLRGLTSLKERVDSTARADWDMSTNFAGALRLILETAVRGNVPADEMPEQLLVVSDMQFNASWGLTGLEQIRRAYESAGYKVPQIVFWNVRATGNVPVRADTNGVALVSGYSPAIMRAVLSADADTFTPEGIMKKAVMLPRYALL